MYHNTTPQERGIRNPNPNPNTTAAAPGGITYGQSPASGPAPTTAGHHKHDIINKLDPRIDSTHDRQPMPQTGNNGKIPEGTYGPHSSRLANALDPRVDSDLDSTRAGAGTGAGGGLGGHATQQPAMAAGGVHHGGAGTGAGYGAGVGAGAGYAPQQHGQVAEGTYGPHGSRIANAADPRVDSDRDNRHLGAAGTAGGAGGGMMSGGPAAAPGQYHSGGAGTHAGMAGHAGAGPHKSGLLNKLDPRVDSKTGTYKDTAGTGGTY